MPSITTIYPTTNTPVTEVSGSASSSVMQKTRYDSDNDGIIAVANGGTGAATVGAAVAALGLDQVDNTSDADKPVSTAQQAALDLKANETKVQYIVQDVSTDGVTLGGTTTNPYGAAVYPSWMYGVGGLGYYDIDVLAGNSIFSRDGSHNLAKRFTYGGLDQSTAVSATANSNRGGFVAGFTAASQVSAYDEFGGCALGAQIDSVPLMWTGTGTFTATKFTPTTPITLSDLIRIEVGMWIRTDETPAFNGQIVSWTTNGSGAVTEITVSNWYARGGSSGTPTATRAYINPQDKVWSHLNTMFLNKLTLTGNTSNGSTAISNISSVSNLYANGQLITGTGIPDGSVIIGVDYSGSIIYISQAATATATGVSLAVSCGTEFNKGVAAEVDIFNNAPPYYPVWITDTGNLTNGGYDVTNLVLTSQWRAGLVVLGTGPSLNYVVSVNYGTNSLKLKYPATVTGTGVALKAFNQFDESGLGFDLVSVINQAYAAYLNRGSFYNGYVSYGASHAAFLCEPHVSAALPEYGFKVDTRINGSPSVAAFAVGNHTTDYWKIDGSGNETVNTVNSTNGYQVGGTTILNNSAWTSFTPTLSAASGTITTVGTCTGKYARIGRTIRGWVKCLITTNGTGASYLIVGSLPFNAKDDTPLSGGRRTDTGDGLAGLVVGASTNCIVQVAAGAGYPGADGGGVHVFFEYEIE